MLYILYGNVNQVLKTSCPNCYVGLQVNGMLHDANVDYL